jgi:hypothetical protein
MKLDEKGRCCGRKPLVYTTGRFTAPEGPQKFCFCCDRSYDLTTGEQIENWAWKKGKDGEFHEVKFT